MYQKGVETNLASRNLPKFGIVPTESMRTYNTKIQTNPGALIGGTEIVNLTDTNAVKRSLMKTLAAGSAITMLQAAGAVGPLQ